MASREVTVRADLLPVHFLFPCPAFSLGQGSGFPPIPLQITCLDQAIMSFNAQGLCLNAQAKMSPLMGFIFLGGWLIINCWQKLDKSSYQILFLWPSIYSWEELGSVLEGPLENV
jgi:hypothetical protein